MRTTITVGLGAAVLATGLMVAGVGPAQGPLAAQPARAALVPFQDCGSLLRWYVDRNVGEVGPWGWGGRMVPMSTMESSARAASPSSPTDAVGNGATGTNTQEAGVDEPDVAKTDGRIVVRLDQAQRTVVLTDVTGATPRDLGSWDLPQGTYGQDLLLVGDHVLVSSSRPMMAMERIAPSPDFPVLPSGTTLTDLDVSDPSRPLVAGTTRWTGDRVSLRQYGDVVRLVTSTGLPDLDFVHPEQGRFSERAATAHNQQVVRDSRIEDWLPGVESGGTTRPAVPCDDVLHPTSAPGRHDRTTLAVSTFRPGAVTSATSVAVTAGGDDAYSSADHLYVTATDWGMRRATTRIHEFALDGTDTRYVASGSVDGSVRDSWSLDEHDGDLRVAVAWPGRDGTTRENGVVVLRESGGRLEEVGAVRHLGPGEDIQSVRWFDDLAVLVTFEQVDPLYTVDLGAPSHPRTLGELKIPGFSAYLHPIGDDRLLGIGADATDRGEWRGAQAGVFDLRDLTRVRRLDTLAFGHDTHLGASDDPHAFTWLPDASAAITTLTDWSTSGTSAVVLLRVADDGHLSVSDLPSPGGYAVRALPLGAGRVALVGDRVLLARVG